MKTSRIKAALAILSTTSVVACSASEQEVNKRQDKKAQLIEFNDFLEAKGKASNDATPGNGDAVKDPVPTVEIMMPAPKLGADASLATLKPADLRLVNKLNATDFVIFAKDGKAWSYKPTAAAADQLKAIEAIVVNPAGSTLYSLPDNQFWFVSPDKLGRHKAKPASMTGEEKTVTVEQFSTGTFLGDKSKMKVLYAAADEIILHLDTHISIVTILPAPAPAQIKQLPIDKLPVDLKGELMAGRSANGYWFRSAAGLFFLSKAEKADVSPWSRSPLAIEPADIVSLAAWPDETAANFIGASLGLSASALYSDVKATEPMEAEMP